MPANPPRVRLRRIGTGLSRHLFESVPFVHQVRDPVLAEIAASGGEKRRFEPAVRLNVFRDRHHADRIGRPAAPFGGACGALVDLAEFIGG